jgi:hypothetical protein
MLGSLAHLERYEKEQVRQELAGPPYNSWAFMPVGRIGRDESNAAKLVTELQSEPMKTALVQAGFAKNDLEFIDLFIENLGRIAGRMRWS